jgi:hypothetical protein
LSRTRVWEVIFHVSVLAIPDTLKPVFRTPNACVLHEGRVEWGVGGRGMEGGTITQVRAMFQKNKKNTR